MSELSELAQRIVSELEEAGFENVPSTMNTVLNLTGTTDDIDEFRGALGEIIQLGLADIGYVDVHMGKLRAVPRDEMEEVIGSLGKMMSFDAAERYWIWDRSQRVAEIIATKAGVAKSHEILEERGYQWWREKK